MEENKKLETETDLGFQDLMLDLENYVPEIPANKLMEMDFPPAEFVVQGLLPKGLAILSGAPKLGKSWMVLDLCIHISTGEPFWGMEVQQGTVWYISYEDQDRRLSERLACLALDGPENLHLSSNNRNPGTMASGLQDNIAKFIRKFPDTKLIVIDTLQMARGNSKDPQYGSDYTDTGAFKELADKYNIAILLVHHNRKATDSDPVNRISGSTGISGAVDTIFVLDKDRTGNEVATMSCTGRDIRPQELKLRFDQKTLTWVKISNSADQDAPQLPPEMKSFVNFIMSIGSYEGGNTTLAEQFTAHSGINLSAKMLKQKMNRYRYELQCQGIAFSSKELHSGKVVSVQYMPPVSHASQVSQK